LLILHARKVAYCGYTTKEFRDDISDCQLRSTTLEKGIKNYMVHSLLILHARKVAYCGYTTKEFRDDISPLPRCAWTQAFLNLLEAL